MRFTKWLIIVVLIVSVIGFLKMRNGTSGAAKGTAVDFSLQDLEGDALNLEEQDDNLILFFWATWCPHCRNKFPKLNKAYSTMQNNDIEVWAIDTGEPKSKVESFIEARSVKFPVLLDIKQEVAGKYKILGVPTFIFIDEDKNILFRGYDLPNNYLDIFANN